MMVTVEGFYAIEGHGRHYPIGSQESGYSAAKSYVNRFFSRGMAKDASYAEVMIWSVGGKSYYRKFKDGQWSSWTTRASKLKNPRKQSTDRAILAAVGRYVKAVDPEMVARMRREGYRTDDVSVGKYTASTYPPTFADIVQYLREDGLIRNPRRNPARRRLVRNPYLEKVLFPSGNWQYRYSQEDVAKRHAKKAGRIESLKGREASLRAGVKRDVGNGDVVALAVALILETYERPGNNESARAGHFGVTGWQCRHLDLHKSRAVIDYIAKSGVHQTKVITTPWIVRALAERQRQCNANGGRLLPTSAASVNSYLDSYDISAKDLRTFGANTEMQRELTAIRKAGPDLSLLKPRDVTKTLKAEFNAALGVVAAKLGHTTSVLRKQYLVQGIEPLYLETGTVLQSFA